MKPRTTKKIRRQQKGPFKSRKGQTIFVKLYLSILYAVRDGLLTVAERDILTSLMSFLNQENWTEAQRVPVRDIGAVAGYSADSYVRQVLQQLEAKGYIRADGEERKAKSYALTEPLVRALDAGWADPNCAAARAQTTNETAPAQSNSSNETAPPYSGSLGQTAPAGRRNGSPKISETILDSKNGKTDCPF